MALKSDSMPSPDEIEIIRGYVPGVVGRCVEMHAVYYSTFANFGAYFESLVASTLSKLLLRIDNPYNEVWSARHDGKIIGTIFIDGEDLGESIGHVSCFIVDDGFRGHGVGRKLLNEALAFVDSRDVKETHLFSFKGLDAARRLYEASGFVLSEEKRGNTFGVEVLEQRFVRTRNQ